MFTGTTDVHPAASHLKITHIFLWKLVMWTNPGRLHIPSLPQKNKNQRNTPNFNTLFLGRTLDGPDWLMSA